MSGRRTRVVLLAVVVAAALTFVLVRGLRSRVPAPGSEPYEQATRAFYHGLAALDVGLLDDARTQFTRATEVVPGEPAAWANLGLAHLRLGELDAAVAPVERALALAPGNAEVALLAGRMETTRGRLDEGIARLRRAVDLEATGVRARMALAEEIERAGGEGADSAALRLLDEVAMRVPMNVAVLLERTRLTAKGTDAGRLGEAVERLAPFATGWPAQAQQQFAALQAAARAGVFPDAVRATVLLRNVLTRVPTFIEGLTAVRTPPELVSEPFVRFLAMQPASAMPSPADMSLTFAAQPMGTDAVDATAVAWLDPAGPPVVLGIDQGGAHTLEASSRRWQLPVPATTSAPDSRTLVLDWNRDFRPDLLVAGGDGLRLWLQQGDGQ